MPVKYSINMKRIITFLAILLLMGFTASAISFSAGITGSLGGNGSSIEYTGSNSTTVVDTNMIFCAEIGAVANFSLNTHFSIQPEFIYHFNNGHAIETSAQKSITKYNTIEIPILCKYQFPINKGNIGLLLGPTLNFILSYIEVENNNISTSATYTSLSSAEDCNFNIFLFGFAAGIEYAFPLGPGDLAIGCRYEHDFLNLSTLDNESVFRSGFLITASYLYKF